MTEKQKSFLKELHELCIKYNIDRISTYGDKVHFRSNWEDMMFGNYNSRDGIFKDIEVSKNASYAEFYADVE